MAQIDWNLIGNKPDVIVQNEVNDQINSKGGTSLNYVSEPHVACCLLVDISGSMQGTKIQALNNALARFANQVCADNLSAKRVDVCLITFNSKAEVAVPFCPITEFRPPMLTASGGTSMGMAIRFAMETVHSQVHTYHDAGVECYKPFVLMITDGYPTDDVSGIETLIANRENEGRYGHLRFHAFGVQGADMDLLARLTKRCLAIDNYDFGQVFNWASTSLQIISHSQVNNQAMGANLGSNMYAYDPNNKQLPWNS